MRERGVQDQSAGVSGYKDKGTILPLATVWHFYWIQSELSVRAEGQKCHFYGVLYPLSLFFVIGCIYQCCDRALKSWPQPKWHTNTGINTSVHFKYRIVLSPSASFFRHRPVFQPVLLAATHLSAGLGCSSALLLLVPSPRGPLASDIPLFLLSLCCLHMFPYPWLPSLASVTFKGGWGSFDGSRPPHTSASSRSSLLHQSRRLFSKKKVPLAELKNNPSAPKAGRSSSPNPRGLCLSPSLFSGSAVFQIFGWYLAPPVWQERQWFYCSPNPAEKRAETGFA